MSCAIENRDSAALARRVPKLAVRNRTTYDGDSIVRPATAATQTSSDNGSLMPSVRPSLQDDSAIWERRRPSDQSGSGSGSSSVRTNNTTVTGMKQSAAVKPKKSGMLGFLTLKEPTNMALEEFAEAQKKKMQEKGTGVTNASGMLSGVSSKRLPDHVPKVNSKWDGLPENAKRKSVESKTTSRSGRESTSASGRRPSTLSSMSTWSKTSDEAKRPYGSLSSRPPQSPQLPNRSSLQSRGTISSIGSSAPIPATDVKPAFRPIVVEETLDNHPQTFLHPPSPPRSRQRRSPPRPQQDWPHELPAMAAMPELDSSELPELDSSEVLAAQELDAARSKDATPVATSPLTPPAGEPTMADVYYSAETLSNALLSNPDSTATFFYSQNDTDHEDVVPRSTTPKQLRQPTINFSRQRAGQARPPPLQSLPEPEVPRPGFTFLDEERPTMSSTLKSSDGRIDPFLTDTFAAQSRHAGYTHSLRQSRDAPTRSSLASSVGSKRSPTLSSAQQPTDAPPRSSFASSVDPMQSPTFSSGPTVSTRPSTATTDVAANIETKDFGAEPNRRDSQASLAPSLAPSTMGASWNMTPKERLGLGSKIRRGNVLPWETAEDMADNSEVVTNRPGSRPGSRPGTGGLLSPSLTDGKSKRRSFWTGSKR